MDRSLISLKHYLDEFDQLQPVLEELKKNYVSSLNGSVAGMLPLDGRLAEISCQFRELVTGLSTPEAWMPSALSEFRLEVSKLQTRYKDGATSALARRDEEIRRILQSLSEAAANLASQAEESDGSLSAVTSKLEALTKVDCLTELRQRLEVDVAELKAATTKLRGSHDGSLQKLRLELRTFQDRWEQSRNEAMTDELTGVSNRRAGERAMRGLIDSGRKLCILLLDLDKFKPINDRYGHQAGDTVLREFAQRLCKEVRVSDVVCRWGGDEFVVVLPDCTLRQAVDRAGRISDSFSAPILIEAERGRVALEVKACVGAAEHHDGESLEGLLSRADERMYHLKGNRR